MDRIQIKNLEIYAYHGVYPEENVLGQRFLIDAELFLDLEKAAASDKLEDSVSYGDVIRFLSREMNREKENLIEKAAGRLVRAVLYAFPAVRKISLTLKKPWAPVKVHLDYAAVTIERGWHRVYVGAGSNIGDRKGWLDLAARRIASCRENRDFRAASYIKTRPWGYTEQEDFLNTVFTFETVLTPEELLHFLQDIEQEAGRIREIHWGPRTLDLDILLYDRLVTEDPALVIPHPLMHKRLFVMEPLCELSPWGVHPLLGERFTDIKEKIASDAE